MLYEPFPVERLRQDFPILAETVRGKPLVYLDNAATGQKPQAVIDTLDRYYHAENANVHRGVHYLSERATAMYEAARDKVRAFLNAADTCEIVFVRGTTEAINLVAQSYGRTFLKAGDEIVITAMEHHSNIVPWQILCEQVGAILRVVPINDDGEMIFAEYERLLDERTRLVSVAHISNALGTINPVRQIVERAHARGVPVLLDGAQAAPHQALDVQALDCDFYAFSGHKLFGPTGIGVLYGKAALLEAMPPYQGGGDMISSVTFEKTTYNQVPYKFEAGTPHIAGAIGLGAAIDYVQALDCDFYAFSGHKLYGPTGTGVLYGKRKWLESMPPYQGGGDMILSVAFDRTTYNRPPYKFEAGTPNMAGAVGLAAALDYLDGLPREAAWRHEDELLAYATERLARVPGLHLVGTAPHKAAVLSFVMDEVHPHDIGTVLDREGIAIRTGHHCAQPLMQRYCIPATARASLGVYNTREEMDALVAALEKVRRMFS